MCEIILTALYKNCTVFYKLIMCFACKSHMYVKQQQQLLNNCRRAKSTIYSSEMWWIRGIK